jgi:trigger factor
MMKTKLSNLKGCRRRIEIEVAADEVEQKFTEVFKEIRKVAEVPGYRAGKVPMDIVQKRYTSQARNEVLKDLIASSYEGALNDLKVVAVELPTISDVKFERGKALSYKADVDVNPEIKLKKYKGLKVNKRKPNATDEDVEKTLSNLQQVNAKFTAADDRAVAASDYVVCNLMCRSGERELFHKDNMWLPAGEDTGIKELHHGIIGMKKDESKEITARLPEDYPDKALAGTDVVYNVTINHVKEKQVPPLDDDFAKDLGRPSMQELREAVKKDLLKRTELAINEEVRKQILEQLLKHTAFDVPESMVHRHLNHLVDDAKERLRSQGLKDEDINAHNKDIEERLKPQAANQVKVFFLLNKIAALEKIKVEQTEVDHALDMMADQFKKDKKQLLQEYEDKNLIQHLMGQIREEKTIEFLIKEADVVEG